MLKTAFGNETIQKTQAFLDLDMGELVKDSEHSGHPSKGHRDENVQKFCNIISVDTVPSWRVVGG
jgi:hypothetical protein